MHILSYVYSFVQGILTLVLWSLHLGQHLKASERHKCQSFLAVAFFCDLFWVPSGEETWQLKNKKKGELFNEEIESINGILSIAMMIGGYPNCE